MRLTTRLFVTLSLFAGAICAARAQDANNLLQDGYFQLGSGTSDPDWGYVGPAGDSFSANYFSNTSTNGDTGAFGNYLVFTTNNGFDGSSGPGLATTLFTAAPGQDLTISFDYKVLEGSVRIGALEGSAISGVTLGDPVGPPPWLHETFTVTGGANAFIFENVDPGALSMELANVDIVTTPSGSPEPFTMGIGVAGICLAVRRRMKAKSAV